MERMFNTGFLLPGQFSFFFHFFVVITHVAIVHSSFFTKLFLLLEFFQLLHVIRTKQITTTIHHKLQHKTPSTLSCNVLLCHQNTVLSAYHISLSPLLTLDLLNSKSETYISVPKCISVVSVVKMFQDNILL